MNKLNKQQDKQLVYVQELCFVIHLRKKQEKSIKNLFVFTSFWDAI